MLGSGDKVRDKVSFLAEGSSFTDLDHGVWDRLMRALCWSWMQKSDPEVQGEGRDRSKDIQLELAMRKKLVKSVVHHGDYV